MRPIALLAGLVLCQPTRAAALDTALYTRADTLRGSGSRWP